MQDINVSQKRKHCLITRYAALKAFTWPPGGLTQSENAAQPGVWFKLTFIGDQAQRISKWVTEDGIVCYAKQAFIELLIWFSWYSIQCSG